MTPLCELAAEYHSDKGGHHFTYGKHGQDQTELCHNYTPIYHILLHKKRETATAILEIGINAGCSQRMWKAYFPNALIYCCDVVPHYIDGVRESRILPFHADQTNTEELGRMMKAIIGETKCRPFDLVVDDGSHETDHQIISANYLMQFVKEDGLYIIEDITDPKRLVDEIKYPSILLDCPGAIGKKAFTEQILVLRHG